MKSIRSHSPGAGKNKTIRRNVIFILLVFLELFVVIGVGFQMLNKHHSDDIYVVTVMALVCVFITIIMTRIYSQYYNKILVQKNKELDDLAYKDALTGLYNRGGMGRKMNELMSLARIKELTGIFIDLDDFKLINDIYGHVAGDQALQNLAGYLRHFFPGAIIGRTGGDEFCVIIYNKSPEECAEEFKRIMPGEKTFSFKNQEIRYTISGGYADYPSQAKDSSELMIMMDTALYAAKISGKKSVMHYKPYMLEINRNHLGFNVKNMSFGMPGAFLIYRAEESEEILFANDHLIDLFECDGYQDFLDYTQSSFKHIVYPDDLDRVEKSIWEQIDRERDRTNPSKKSYEDYVQYRIQTKTGKIRRVIDLGRLVHDQHYGVIFYVFIMDVEKLKREIDLEIH